MCPKRSDLYAEILTEARLTRPFLKRLPGLDLDWTPAPGMWTLGTLATHLAVIPHWGVAILQNERHDMATASGWSPPTSITVAQIEERFQHNMELLLEEVSKAALGSLWVFCRGPVVLAEHDKRSAIRHYVLGHLAHHRGQLALYLRMIGAPVSGSYGSSRDEAPESTAS